MHVKASTFNCTLIQIYSQTSEYSDEEVEKCYEQIKDTIQQIPKKDFIVVMGD